MSFPNDPLPPKGSSVPNPYGASANFGDSYSPVKGPGSGYGGPYAPPGAPPPAEKGKGCLVAGIVVGILTVMLVPCVACCGFGFYVLEGQHQETARQLSVNHRNDPKLVEEVGEVQEITHNWSSTLARENDNYDVYDVQGDKGKAQLIVEADEEGTPIFVQLQSSRGEWTLPSEAESLVP